MPLGKILIIFGLVLVGVGIYFQLGGRFPQLPGDISIKGEKFSFHFPIVTCLVLSILLTILFRLFNR